MESCGEVSAEQLGMSLSQEQFSKGGVVADTVGMGKTAQIIALMLSRPRTVNTMPKDELAHNYQGNNLIVTPGHLCRQWQGEINRYGQRLTMLNCGYCYSVTLQYKLAFRSICEV